MAEGLAAANRIRKHEPLASWSTKRDTHWPAREDPNGADGYLHCALRTAPTLLSFCWNVCLCNALNSLPNLSCSLDPASARLPSPAVASAFHPQLLPPATPANQYGAHAAMRCATWDEPWPRLQPATSTSLCYSCVTKGNRRYFILLMPRLAATCAMHPLQ